MLPFNLLSPFSEESLSEPERAPSIYAPLRSEREKTIFFQPPTLPTPAEEDFCAKGAKFGPHNLHENRPGSFQSEDLIFATYHNAGLRVYDIRDAFQPKEVAYFVPPPPERIVDQRPNPAKVIQSCDVYVDVNGVMYLTDTNAGLYILQYDGL